MNNFELIDDYLTNRLGDAEKVAFEKQLASDPSLKADVALQKYVLEGVKKARASELKAMLQKVPVGGSASFNFPMLRMAAGVVGAGLLIAALSFYFKNGKEVPNMSSSIEDSINKADPKDFEPLEEPTVAPTQPTENKEKKATETVDKKQDNSTKETARPTEQNKPKIEAIDPSNEIIDNTEKTSVAKEVTKSTVTTSHIAVDVDSANKKYSFHYQFSKGKLMLYGSFDKALYEILEINGENHSVFMFYKDNYYLLNEKQSSVIALEPIKDKALIARLSEYRGR
jgi:cytoskeletal protein RodZ